MAPPRKRQKVSTASQSTTTTLSRNVSAASTHSTPPHTPPNQSTTPIQATALFTPNYVKHLIANLDVELQDRATRLRNHYNLLASTLRIRGEARMSRIPSHLRSIKIKELREMQKRGLAREKQVYADVLGTRLLASANRPKLKRKPSEDEASDLEGQTGNRAFSQNSESDRSPSKVGSTLPRGKTRTLQSSQNGRNITRGVSVNSKRGRK